MKFSNMLRQLPKLTVLTLIALISMGNSCEIKTGSQDKTRITIPMDLSTNRPVVAVMINDTGPYSFIFDTGSSGNVIDEGLSEKLGLEVIGEDPLRTPGSDNQLMSKRVKVSNVSFENTGISEEAIMNTIALREMLPVDGILSPIFFTDYLIAIDYPSSNLILTTDQLDENDDGVMPFIQKPRVINLNVSVSGNVIEAHLDSGNPGGINIPYSLKDKLEFMEEPKEAGVINTPVASFKRWDATLLGDIEIGSVVYKNPKVSLIEDFQFVNLGYQFFSDLKITIDKKNSLIKLEQSNSTRVSEQMETKVGEGNEYTGWYGGQVRQIFLEDGEMYLQRKGSDRLKLVEIQKDQYEMTYKIPVNNELPLVRFERDDSNEVIGLTFVFKDGRMDYVKKDN